MEEKYIKLCNFLTQSELQRHKVIKISNSIKYLFLQLIDSTGLLYKLSGYDIKPLGPILSCNEIGSCIFSEEENELFIVTSGKVLRRYKLNEDSVVLVGQKSYEEMCSILDQYNNELINDSTVVLERCSQDNLILCVNKEWLVNIKWCLDSRVFVKYKVEISSCVTIVAGRNILYTLTVGGNVSAYDITDGKCLGVVHLYSMVPPQQARDVLRFTHMSVTPEGDQLVVADRASQVFVVNLSPKSFQLDGQEQQRWDCGTSVLSFGSDTSSTTTASQQNLKMIDDTVSLSPSVSQEPEPQPATSSTLTWSSYLQSLNMKSKSIALGHAAEDTMLMTRMPSAPSGLVVRGLHIISGELSVSYTEPDSVMGGVYHLHDLTSGVLTEEKVPADTVVLSGGLLRLKDAFITSKGIWLFLGNLSKDSIVSKLLHCLQMESLGHLLQGEAWANLMVPLPAVATSLKQQQLDVASLALDLHVHGLKTTFCSEAKEEVDKEENIKRHSGDLDCLLSIILDAACELQTKPALREQLILCSLEKLNSLLQFISTEKHRGAQEVLHKVMSRVVQLRQHLLNQPAQSVCATKPYDCLEPEVAQTWEQWHTLSDEVVIRDSVSRNCIPLAQIFLLQTRNWKKKTFQQDFNFSVDAWISELMEGGQFDAAEEVLCSIGKNSNEELLSNCIKAQDPKLRDQLAEHLSAKGLLPSKETEAWHFIKKVEDIIDIVDISSSRSLDSATILQELQFSGTNLPIVTIVDRPHKWKMSVLASLFFNVPGTIDLHKEIQPEYVWVYLLESNRDDMLCTWVTCCCARGSADVPESVLRWAERLANVPLAPWATDYKCHTVDDLLRVFSEWPITQNMVDEIAASESMQVTKEKVLNHLSRYGIFSTDEKGNICAILKRTVFTGCVENIKDILTQKTSNVTFDDFQVLLTVYIINNDLPEVAFTCLEDFEYSDNQLQSVKDKCENNRGWDWFSLWIVFREMKRNVEDSEVAYQAILQTAVYLSEGNLQQYLRENPLVVMGLLVYSGKHLAEVFSSGKKYRDIDAETLATTLEHYPLLAKSISTLDEKYEEKPDITFYELLQGNAPFDVSRLFGWQEAHRIPGEEFPHFSSPKLVHKYGMEFKMTYLVYLKLARPCFAFCRFVIDQYKIHGTLSRKRIQDACGATYRLALQNFNDMEVTTSCLAFIGMCGEDADKLKVELSVAKKVSEYLQIQSKEQSSTNTCSMSIVGDLLYGLCVREKKSAESLMTLLEKALIQELAYNDGLPVSTKAIDDIARWGVAVKFAQYHELKLPEMYLKQQTSENKWLQFLLFVDIYRYPLHQVKHLCESFSSEILQEHMFHALKMELALDSKQESVQDPKRTFYAKSLPKKSKSKQDEFGAPSIKSRKKYRRNVGQDHIANVTDSKTGLATSVSSGSSGEEMSCSSLISYEVWKGDEKNDTILVLLKCHNTPDPPRALLQYCVKMQNSLYAVYANCYDTSLAVTCFCVWLFVSLPPTSQDTLKPNFGEALETLEWTEQNVFNLIEEIVSCQYVKALQKACFVFLPESPLNDFANFLSEAVVKRDFKECLLKMKLFKASYLNLRNFDTSKNSGFISDAHWLGCLAVRLTILALARALTSLHFQLEFLKILQDGKFLEHLPEPHPDLELMERIAKCFVLTGVYPNLEVLSENASSPVHMEEVAHCLKQLLGGKHYSAALQLAAATGLSKDPVLLAQWEDKFERSCKENMSLGRDYLGFWKRCYDVFKEEGVQPLTAAKFFKEQAEKVEKLPERYRVLQIVVLWLQAAAATAGDGEHRALWSELASAELLMWNSWMQADTDLPLTVEEKAPELLYMTKEQVLLQSGISCLPVSTELNTEEEKLKLESLIGKLLDSGDLATACRVEAIYKHKSQDLRILLLCLGLAEGELSPYELTAEQRMLFRDVPSTRSVNRRHRALLSSISSMAHSPGTAGLLTDYEEIPPRDRQDTLTTLEKLTGRLKNGTAIGNRVVMCYRVAMNLDMNYQELLILRDPLILLKTALADDCMNKFIVASDLITAAQISDNEVAAFLAGEIFTAIKKSKLKGEIANTNMWGVDLETCFHLVLDICKDQNALGTKLLSLAFQNTASENQDFYEVHVIAVELAIYSHDCFVAALNMEGIGSVLRMCYTISKRLAIRKEWALMVRLLTGIGRYMEMNYMFKILYENEQFEFLLGKGLDKIKGLKHAVMKFARLHCPNDKKLREMVTLRFGMYGEVAELWESDGKSEVQILMKLTIKNTAPSNESLLPNTADVNKHLLNAMECFKHAAEFYLKAERLIRAACAAEYAELVALQVYRVSTVSSGQGAPLLLEITAAQSTNLITNLLSFPEACIVARAYRYPVDWAAALYQHCVLENDDSYFTQYTANFSLNASVVEDMARRYMLDRTLSAEKEQMMKKFVQLVDSLELKYRLAGQLGFKDMSESLINGPEDDVAYLKDTVWQHGFQN